MKVEGMQMDGPMGGGSGKDTMYYSFPLKVLKVTRCAKRSQFSI